MIRSLKKSSLDLNIYGSNMDGYVIAKSNADKTFKLPASTEPGYIDSIKQLVNKESIDLIIPNNDREVNSLAEHRDEFVCKIFLPPIETVQICQDKYKMYQRLVNDGIPVAESYPLECYEDIENAFIKLEDKGERFWVRLRKGSGSRGATWVKTKDQARSWISLWENLRGYSVNNFTISEFLPGRDYAFQSVWKNGELVVCKMCERLSYFMGSNRLSGMSSTPEVARTVRDEQALNTIFKAIKSVCNKPHGNFCLDLKGNKDGIMNITEFNIGRFCMITPIFDLTGKVNTAEAYVRSAFDEIMKVKDPIDIEEDMYLLRDLDTEPTIAHKSIIDAYKNQEFKSEICNI